MSWISIQTHAHGSFGWTAATSPLKSLNTNALIRSCKVALVVRIAGMCLGESSFAQVLSKWIFGKVVFSPSIKQVTGKVERCFIKM